MLPNIAIFLGKMYAATDTRWYLNLPRNIYRILPAFIIFDDFSKDNYLKLVNFYHHVMLSASKGPLGHAALKDEL